MSILRDCENILLFLKPSPTGFNTDSWPYPESIIIMVGFFFFIPSSFYCWFSTVQEGCLLIYGSADSWIPNFFRRVIILYSVFIMMMSELSQVWPVGVLANRLLCPHYSSSSLLFCFFFYIICTKYFRLLLCILCLSPGIGLSSNERFFLLAENGV